jgi:hypothetical protein
LRVQRSVAVRQLSRTYPVYLPAGDLVVIGGALRAVLTAALGQQLHHDETTAAIRPVEWGACAVRAGSGDTRGGDRSVSASACLPRKRASGT